MAETPVFPGVPTAAGRVRLLVLRGMPEIGPKCVTDPE